MVALRKLKLIYPSIPQHYNSCLAPSFLAPPTFIKEGRDYTFYMKDYKGETTKLLPFYMKDFLFTEL